MQILGAFVSHAFRRLFAALVSGFLLARLDFCVPFVGLVECIRAARSASLRLSSVSRFLFCIFIGTVIENVCERLQKAQKRERREERIARER